MKNITNLINSLLEKSEFTFDSKSRFEPGFAAVVLKDNNVVWQKCSGLADVGRRIPITQGTNFRLASLSKQFTAMAVLILIERKKLNFENKLVDFFSDYPAYGNKVLVKQLLTHTAGIPDHEKPLYRAIRSGDEPTIYDALEILKSQPSPLFPPGSKYKYSDAGYVLLALIIEKVSGFSYREFLKQNVFLPLQMVNSDVLDQTKPRIKNRAVGYKITRLPHPAKGGARNDDKCFDEFDYDPLNYIVGDEGVYSSIEDMIKWNRAWSEEVLVSKKSLSVTMTPARLVNGEFGKARFSWLIRNYRGRKIVYQSGSWVGFRNILLMLPKKSLTVILLSNRTDFNNEKQRIAAAYKLAQKFI